jgi:hypothetical protein
MNKPLIRFSPKKHPYEPVDYDELVVMAVRALSTGTANSAQQAEVWAWLQYVTGTGEYADLSFRPGGAEAERESAFAEGKKFCGLQIMKMLHPATLEVIERERRAKAMTDIKKKGPKK